MKVPARDLNWPLRISAVAAVLMLSGCLNMNDGATTATSDEAVAPAAADTLTLLGEPPTEVSSNSNYFFQPATSGDDASTDRKSGNIAFSITNKPDWLNFDAQTGALSGVPSDAQIGLTDEITIVANRSQQSGSIGPFRITVKQGQPAAAAVVAAPADAAPVISGFPATAVAANQSYSFVPAASDPDGSVLSFSIVNRPSWATFDTSTGKLSGIPKITNVGRYANIMVRASDGSSSASLPAFSIDVSGAMTAVNIAPSISGIPTTAAITGVVYSFTPSATDANSDSLSFTIANKPSWATFNAATGQIVGTPTVAGTSSNVTISVTDGKATSTLSAFTITVANAANAASGVALVTWTAPSLNTDGTALTDLAGFHVYAGRDPSNLTRRADIVNGSNLQYQASGLDAGTWFFTITAYNSNGVESAQPTMVSTTI